MPRVSFNKKGITIDVLENTLLLDCIRNAGLKIETPCNGIGLCGKCKVIAKGELSIPSEEEKKFIDCSKGERLACLTRVLGDVEVELIETKKELKSINKGSSIAVALDSTVKKVELPNIDDKASTPYADTIKYTIKAIDIYSKIAEIENNPTKNIHGIVFGDELLDIKEDFDSVLGVAVDIGTTGISSYLLDIETGKVINKLSSLNPQTQFGGDVLSRITYCMNNKEGSKKLKEVIIAEINRIIIKLTEDKYSPGNVYHVAIAGNTTMLHLLLGINPSSLARAPYRPVFLDGIDAKGRDMGIGINYEGIVTLLPSASAYVGGDIVSGIAAYGFSKLKHPSIFVDIGTNGEIAAIKNGRLMATSTAAGPALEGMNISCGCRAQAGAIEAFSIDEEFNLNYSTIDGMDALGTCGSGLIDIAAELVRKNIVLKSGKFNSNLDPKIKDRLIDKKFYITDDIYISQKDIRQIQLAKGAIASGIVMLLDEMGLEIGDVDEAVIAGAFGYHVNPESIKTIGLIPKGFKGKITFAGNTSLEGARLAIINKDCLKEMKCLRKEMKVLELSTSDKFQDFFIKQLNF